MSKSIRSGAAAHGAWAANIDTSKWTSKVVTTCDACGVEYHTAEIPAGLPVSITSGGDTPPDFCPLAWCQAIRRRLERGEGRKCEHGLLGRCEKCIHATAMAELKAATEERDKLVGLLRDIEWSGAVSLGSGETQWDTCPLCDGVDTEGHRSDLAPPYDHVHDCEIAAALAKHAIKLDPDVLTRMAKLAAETGDPPVLPGGGPGPRR